MNARTWKSLLLFASIHLLIGWVAKTKHSIKDQQKLEVKSLLDHNIPAFSKSEVTE